ncbi:MAG TPA: FtsX-like permease family protein [Terriglobia bacterium]|nr:FtsX-like permease family protein [Terriglobia bacterium]
MRRFLPFEWILATRFLGEGIMQTLLIITGVSVGVSVIVFMSALLTGLQTSFLSRIFASQAQVVLEPPDEIARPLRHDDKALILTVKVMPSQRLRSIDQWQKVSALVQRLPGVLVTSPMASAAAFATRGEVNKSISLMGIEPDRFYKIVDLPGKLVRGSPWLEVQDILIGTQLGIDLGVDIGDKLRVTTGTGASQVFTIRGIFDLGNKGANQRNTYVMLHTAQPMIGLIDGVTSIDVTMRDVYQAEELAQYIAAFTGIKAESWIKTNADFFSVISSQNISNTAIRLFVGLSVIFGISSVLVVSVVQKSREIGILRAMGASRSQILRLFLLQGAIVGFLGSLIGSGFAYFILDFWQAYARRPDGTPLFTAEIDTNLVVATALIATLSGVLAALLPASRAARLEPVVAIRG